MKYVAFQVPGGLDPYPSWFQVMVDNGVAKHSEDGPVVKTITGVWRTVSEGDWIVYAHNGWVWEMANDAFSKLFYEHVVPCNEVQ